MVNRNIKGNIKGRQTLSCYYMTGCILNHFQKRWRRRNSLEDFLFCGFVLFQHWKDRRFSLSIEDRGPSKKDESRVSQPQDYWHVGLGISLLWKAACALQGVQQHPGHPLTRCWWHPSLPTVVTTKNVSSIVKCALRHQRALGESHKSVKSL